jgi:TolB-like protein/DNA-binding winged helix-turn-helix (wHTH) protein/Flp pilus assembly protein TadD
MPGSKTPLKLISFGPFEADLPSQELRKQGVRLRLPRQSFQILRILLERPGALVTRDELRAALWPSDTFVDFEHGLNAAINRLRETLGDDADNPRYIETLPRRGYRYVGPLEPPPVSKSDSVQVEERRSWLRSMFRTPLIYLMVLLLALVACAIAIFTLNLGGVRQHLFSSRNVAPVNSIAVLPLANLSRDPEQEYFSDGMTEELITELSQIRSLKVISRTSVMHYKGSDKPLPQIARELNVDGIIEGAVLRSGDRVRITAQLIYGPSDTHLWAKSYEGDLHEVLTLQSEVAQAIAREVQTTITPQEQTRLATARPVNPDAYVLYLKGRYEWNKRTEEGLKRSLEYFQQAINLDSTYALAHSGVADSYSALGDSSFLPGTEVYPKSRAAALRAFELDKNLAETQASLAQVSLHNFDWADALSGYQTAIQLNPNYASAHHWYALALAYTGRSEEAIREIQQARTLDPLSARINANVVLVLYLGRQYDRAIVEAHKALELEPKDASTHGYLGRVYLIKGLHREAHAEFETLLSLNRADSGVLPGLANAFAAVGNRQEALGILGELKQQSKQEYISPFYLAMVYSVLGERGEALALLQKGLEVHDGAMVQLKVEPMLDPLRPDPRFQDLLRRMNFPP